MKTKSFKKLLENRLDEKEIAEIEAAAKLEYEVLATLQTEIAKTVINYMAEKGIGFNELVRKLGKSPTQVTKIINGKANLTLATIAQLFAFMKQKPHIISRYYKK